MSSIYDAVREICLGMPQTEEIISHGFPTFKVTGKAFATYSLNHHGDEKVALLLNMDRENQQMLVNAAPDYFFVPPYTGPKGWVGIELNKEGLEKHPPEYWHRTFKYYPDGSAAWI